MQTSIPPTSIPTGSQGLPPTLASPHPLPPPPPTLEALSTLRPSYAKTPTDPGAASGSCWLEPLFGTTAARQRYDSTTGQQELLADGLQTVGSRVFQVLWLRHTLLHTCPEGRLAAPAALKMATDSTEQFRSLWDSKFSPNLLLRKKSVLLPSLLPPRFEQRDQALTRSRRVVGSNPGAFEPRKLADPKSRVAG